MSTSHVEKSQIQNLPSPTCVRTEADRRAKFVRGLGGSVVGYCDGYADGFEHAVAWLLGQACDPLALEYRPGAGMSHPKDHYKYRRKERARILEWFKNLHGNPRTHAKALRDDDPIAGISLPTTNQLKGTHVSNNPNPDK